LTLCNGNLKGSEEEDDEEEENEGSEEDFVDHDDKAKKALIREDIELLKDIMSFAALTKTRISLHLESEVDNLRERNRKPKPKKHAVRRDDNIVEKAVGILLQGAPEDDSGEGSEDEGGYVDTRKQAWGTNGGRNLKS
jgi:hypothetical protein